MVRFSVYLNRHVFVIQRGVTKSIYFLKSSNSDHFLIFTNFYQMFTKIHGVSTSIIPDKSPPTLIFPIQRSNRQFLQIIFLIYFFRRESGLISHPNRLLTEISVLPFSECCLLQVSLTQGLEIYTYIFWLIELCG